VVAGAGSQDLDPLRPAVVEVDVGAELLPAGVGADLRGREVSQFSPPLARQNVPFGACRRGALTPRRGPLANLVRAALERSALVAEHQEFSSKAGPSSDGHVTLNHSLVNVLVHLEAEPQGSSRELVGLIAGRFEIVRPLGDGAFATVYEAIDHDLGRRVALKLFTSYAQDDIDSALREARAMARLNHENVLAVHDIGEHRGTPFLALEYAEMDLRRWLAAGAREGDEILHLFVEAGRGLAAAHRAGLVHHDFKSANVMLRANGCAAVGDFGLARYLDSHDGESERGPSESGSYTFGTLRYIAPERLIGLPGDERSDQFSFCVALWEALARRHPFSGSSAQARYDSIAAGPSGSPRAASHVVKALRRGLSLEAYDRFETLDDLLEAITDPQHCRPLRWLHRGLRPVLTATMLASVFVVGVGLSREAPALDVQVTPATVLTADAAMDHLRDLAFDGDNAAYVPALFNTLPVVRETSSSHQQAYLAQLEVLGDLLSEAGAHREASYTYAAAKNLAKDLGLDPTKFVDKRSQAQAKANRFTRALTRGK
jgi:serine/threonine protein kinase